MTTSDKLRARALTSTAELPPERRVDPKIRKVYLAGPMRGIAEFNFPAFQAATADLRGRGLTVWSPAERDLEEDGFDPKTSEAKPLAHYMKYDLPAVCDSHAVVLLPGWETSTGARLEVHVARECEIPVLSYPHLEKVDE